MSTKSLSITADVVQSSMYGVKQIIIYNNRHRSVVRVWCQTNHYLFLSPTHSSRSLNDRWGFKDNRITTFLHSSLSSAFRRASSNPNLVHSDMLSSHLFSCLPFLLPPCTVPCRIIFASPVDLFMYPYHINLRFLSVVIRSLYGPIACLLLFLTSSFVT